MRVTQDLDLLRLSDKVKDSYFLILKLFSERVYTA